MSSLTRVTNMELEVSRAFDAAKDSAIAEFASATVEEIMLRAAEKRLAILEQRRQLVLRSFNVTDVSKLGERLAKNKYAAEKLQEIFGGVFELLKDQTGRPLCDIQIVKDDPDVGEVRIYTYYGRYTRPDGKSVEQMGSFSTKDQFFAKAHDEWKRIDEIDVTAVMVAAQTETYKKCIFRGTGLGDWTEGEGEQLRGEAKGHDFKGSQAGTGDKDATVAFGKSKGMKVTQLAGEDLAWYAKAYAENVVDESKAKYKKANERILTALRAEQQERERRTSQETDRGPAAVNDAPSGVGDGPTPSPSNDPSKAGDEPAPGTPATRGGKINALWTKLEAACGKDQKTYMKVIRVISGEWGNKRSSLTDLTDEELGQFIAIPPEILKTVVANLPESEKAGLA